MWNYKNKSFNTAVLIYGVLKLFVLYKYFVIAVRVSGGYLCEAETPTEPAGVRINFRLPVIASAVGRVAIRSFFNGNYGFFRAPHSE